MDYLLKTKRKITCFCILYTILMKERKLIDETTRNCWQVLIKGALKSVLILNYEIDDISQRVWGARSVSWPFPVNKLVLFSLLADFDPFEEHNSLVVGKNCIFLPVESVSIKRLQKAKLLWCRVDRHTKILSFAPKDLSMTRYRGGYTGVPLNILSTTNNGEVFPLGKSKSPNLTEWW